MSNKIEDLRAVLFESIRAVKDGSMPLDRAKMIGELTQVVVNSAKVEVEFIRATEGKGVASGFIGQQVPGEPDVPTGTLPRGFVGSRTHHLSDDEPGAA